MKGALQPTMTHLSTLNFLLSGALCDHRTINSNSSGIHAATLSAHACKTMLKMSELALCVINCFIDWFPKRHVRL